MVPEPKEVTAGGGAARGAPLDFTVRNDGGDGAGPVRASSLDWISREDSWSGGSNAEETGCQMEGGEDSGPDPRDAGGSRAWAGHPGRGERLPQEPLGDSPTSQGPQCSKSLGSLPHLRP